MLGMKVRISYGNEHFLWRVGDRSGRGRLARALRAVLYLVQACGLLRELLPKPPAPGRDDVFVCRRRGDNHSAYCAWRITLAPGSCRAAHLYLRHRWGAL